MNIANKIPHLSTKLEFVPTGRYTLNSTFLPIVYPYGIIRS
jgi:hypothetical protein